MLTRHYSKYYVCMCIIYVLTHLSMNTRLCSRYYCYYQLVDKETEAQTAIKLMRYKKM